MTGVKKWVIIYDTTKDLTKIDTNKKIEFHDIPADLNAAFGLEIPRELLSESQLKEKQKAEASSADEEESLSEEE